MKLKELASICNVSVSTVSKALKNSKEISEPVKKMIVETAIKNNCYGKYANEKFHKKVIAVLLPEFISHYYSEQLHMLEAEISKHNGICICSEFSFSDNKFDELFLYFSENIKADGIITYKYPKNYRGSIPVVCMEKNQNNTDNSNISSINLSFDNAISEAVKSFIKNNHRKIAFICDKLTLKKFETYKKVLKLNKIEINPEYFYISEKRFSYAGYEGMHNLLSLKNPPDAVLCSYDSIALGAIKAIYEKGLKIPENISITGMDDVLENNFLPNKLSSITSFNEDLAEIVVKTLFDKINNKNEIKIINLSTKLIERDT